jgi:hypothetical protein
MSLDEIAESIGTIHHEQEPDDGSRFSDEEPSHRSMEEYDGGWTVGG